MMSCLLVVANYKLGWLKTMRPIAYTAAFAIGLLVSGSDLQKVNAWINGSMIDLGVASEEGDTYGNKELLKADPEIYDDITVYPAAEKYEILISFDDSGLALLKNGVFSKFKNDNGYFLMEHLQNGNPLVRPWKKFKKPFMAEIVVNENSLEVLDWVRVPRNIHHWSHTFNGHVYHPSRIKMKATNKKLKQLSPIFENCDAKNVNADTIVVLDKKTGAIMKQFDILEKIAAAKLKYPVISKKFTYCDDPLHINDALPIKTKDQADLFPNANIGDIVVSIRNISSIIVIDGEDGTIKWHLNGKKNNKFAMQHSPRISERGTLLVFDNQGSDKEFGHSRIMEIDIKTKEVIGKYEGTKDEYFSSHQRGRIEILNNNQYFIQEQYYNHIKTNTAFILTCSNGVISNNCIREDLFTVPIPKHYYNNAQILKTIDE